MKLPTREKGLQIGAVLSLGNCLYSVLMACIASVIGYSLANLDWSTLPSFANTFKFWALGATFFLASAYYFFDWYDLNQVTYYDKKLGRLQIFLWVLSVCVLSVTIYSSLKGTALITLILAVSYIPFTILVRDHLILPDNKKGANHNFKCGMLLIGIIIVVLATVCFLIYLRIEHGAEKCDNNWFTGIGVLLWVIALIWKIIRSFTNIAIHYEKAINEIAEASK